MDKMDKKITISQALKKKNKLTSKIENIKDIILSYNSIEVPGKRPYSIQDKIKELNSCTNELVELKAKIHTANIPVYRWIFTLAELKGLIKTLKNMSVVEGKRSSGYSAVAAEYEVEIDLTKRDEYILNYEEEIESLQDKLDAFNASTFI